MKFKKAKKRPVEIEYFQLTEDMIRDVDCIDELRIKTDRKISITNVGLVINTLEGDMKANVGDYIIKGIKGELYPCRKDIFEETYDLINLEES